MDISLQRTADIHTAIELGVDASDYRFLNAAERELWNEFVLEHEARVDMNDSVWLAAA